MPFYPTATSAGRTDERNQYPVDVRQSAAPFFAGMSNFILSGDLNTMGMTLTYSNRDISSNEEIERLTKRMGIGAVKMIFLSKTDDFTYWPGSTATIPKGNLDHVVAADHLQSKNFNGSELSVRRWVDEPSDEAKDKWAAKYSNRSML